MPWAVLLEATDHVVVSPATGVSFDARFNVPVDAFSVALNASFVAVGLIGATLIVTVAVEEWPEPSVTVYVNVSAPLKPAFGV